jgi:hypothetical protein
LKDKSIIDRRQVPTRTVKGRYHLTPVASSDGSNAAEGLRRHVVYENVDRQRSFRRQSMMALERRLTSNFPLGKVLMLMFRLTLEVLDLVERRTREHQFGLWHCLRRSNWEHRVYG